MIDDPRWIAADDLAAALGVSRRDLAVIRRHARQPIRRLPDPSQPIRRLLSVPDAIAALTGLMALTSAQIDRIAERSRTLLPAVGDPV